MGFNHAAIDDRAAFGGAEPREQPGAGQAHGNAKGKIAIGDDAARIQDLDVEPGQSPAE